MTVVTLLKLSDAQKALGPGAPSVDTLRREIARGNLHAKRIGRLLRVSETELNRWASEFSSKGSADAGTAAGSPTLGGVPNA